MIGINEIQFNKKYNQSKQMSTNCSYKTFNPELLTNKKPELRQAKPKPGQQQSPPYFIVPLSYNYGTEDKPRYDELNVEGCEITCGGIKSKPSMSDPNKLEESILIKFNPSNENEMLFLSFFQKLHMASSELIGKIKILLKRKNYDSTNPEGNSFKSPIYTPIDEMGEIIPGKYSSIFLKLYTRGSYHTLFTGLDKKEIDKKLLHDVSLKFIPLITVKHIHVGATISLQMEIKSAIVISAEERKLVTTQDDTINQLLIERPDLQDLLSAHLALLRLNKQESLLPPPNNTDNTENNDEKNDDLSSGINPTDQNINIPNIPNVSTSDRRQFKIPLNN
jgi:hypothetical protein